MTTLVAVSTRDFSVFGSDSRVTNGRGNWADGVEKITSVSDLLIGGAGDLAITETMVDIIETYVSGLVPMGQYTLSEPVSIRSQRKGRKLLKPGIFSLRKYLSETSHVRQIAKKIRDGVADLDDNSLVLVAGLEDFGLVFCSDGSYYVPLSQHGPARISIEGSGGAYALGAATAFMRSSFVEFEHPAAAADFVRETIGSAIACDRDSGGDIMVAVVTKV